MRDGSVHGLVLGDRGGGDSSRGSIKSIDPSPEDDKSVAGLGAVSSPWSRGGPVHLGSELDRCPCPRPEQHDGRL